MTEQSHPKMGNVGSPRHNRLNAHHINLHGRELPAFHGKQTWDPTYRKRVSLVYESMMTKYFHAMAKSLGQTYMYVYLYIEKKIHIHIWNLLGDGLPRSFFVF